MKTNKTPNLLIATLTLTLTVLSSCSSGGGEDTPTPPPAPVIEAPGKSALTAPANNAPCQDVNTAGQVTFQWSAATNAETYDLKITNLNTNASSSQTDITGTSKSVTLNRGIPYSWQVTAKNKGTTTTASDTWRFYLAGDGVVNYAPFPASPLSPTPGATVTPTEGKVTISWESGDADGDALTYTLYADAVDGAQSPAASNVTATSFSLSVQAGTVYYWRVVANDGKNTATSILYTFKTAG